MFSKLSFSSKKTAPSTNAVAFEEPKQEAVPEGGRMTPRQLRDSKVPSAETDGSESSGKKSVTSKVDLRAGLQKAKSKKFSTAQKPMSISDYDVLNKLGEGGFGTVLLVRKKDTGKLYALKVLVKKHMKIEDGERAIQESSAMQELSHPFVVNLHYAFQDPLHIYFCLEFVSRGDLYDQIAKRKFPEAWCKIYVAEVALALEHCHKHNFVYRDLKPENVLVSADGHLKLADFGLAKKMQEGGGRLTSMVGSYHSIAPEVFMESDYGASVDFWALGILYVEMITNDPPIVECGEENFREMLQNYEEGTHINMKCLQRRMSPVAVSLAVGLLTVSTKDRLGTSDEGPDGLHNHPFFEGLDWDALLQGEVEAPLNEDAHDGDALDPFLGGRGKSSLADDYRRQGMSEEQVEEAQKAKETLDTVLDTGFKEFVNNMEEQDDAEIEAAWSAMLCDAASKGDLPKLRELIENGAPVDTVDYENRTALHLAATNGQQEVVKFLIDECCANANPVDRFGASPMDDAIRAKHLVVVEYLREHGGNEQMAKKDRSMDLCAAAQQGNLTALRVLVVQGTDVNQGDYDNRTAAHLAAVEGHEHVLRFLFTEANANPNVIDRWGHTPLDDAIKAKQPDAIDYIQSQGGKKGKYMDKDQIAPVESADFVATSTINKAVRWAQDQTSEYDRHDPEGRLMGARVVFVGLTDADLNGTTGFATEFDPKKQRYIVHLETKSDEKGKPKRLKCRPVNLRHHERLLNDYDEYLKDEARKKEAAGIAPQNHGERLGILVPKSPDPFLCPLTQKTFQDPVVAKDGHTYEREALLQWWEACGSTEDDMEKGGSKESKDGMSYLSPITGAVIEDNVLHKNTTILDAHMYFKSKMKLLEGKNSMLANGTFQFGNSMEKVNPKGALATK